jgi:DNA-binding transcriptional LysR family regulator
MTHQRCRREVREVIDGPVRLAADNMQTLLAAALAGADVTYGPSFAFGEAIANGNLNVPMSGHRTSEFWIHGSRGSV